MGIKSPYASGCWPRMAIVDGMQDDCLAFHNDGGGLRDGTGSRSRSGLLRDGGLGCPAAADDAALPTTRESRLSSPVRAGSPGGSYGTAVEGHALSPAMLPVEIRLTVAGTSRGDCSGSRAWTVARRTSAVVTHAGQVRQPTGVQRSTDQ